ncbi:MAG: 3-dehydroquinate synthase, partial [Dehalococcoidia bacterium]
TRTILNYGHTIAHGLEAATGYERFLHGEAVAVGMMGAARISQHIGMLSEDSVKRQEDVLRKFELPISCSGVDAESIMEAMELDKKILGRRVRWVLLEDIGRPVISGDVPDTAVETAVRELLKS